MKELIILRHAKSDWDDPKAADFDRPLAKRGRKAAEHLAPWLVKKDCRPDLVLCSSSRRTRETLALIRASLGRQAKIRYEKRLYLASVDELRARLARVPPRVHSVMVIAHNPGTQQLALELTPPDARAARAHMAVKFPTAALAWFRFDHDDWSDLAAETAQLVAYVTPADL